MRPLVRDEVEQRRGEEQPGEVLRRDDLFEGLAVQVPGRGDDGRPAAQQRRPHLVDRGVERVRRVDEHPVVRPVPEPLVGGEVDRVAVPDHDALGRPRRAGGEQHAGELLRMALDGRVGAGPRGDPWVLIHDDDPRGRAEAVGAVAHDRVDEEDGRADLGDRPRHPLGRVAVVDRRVRAARLEDRQRRHDGFGGSLQQDRDGRLRADSELDEKVRQPVGARVQLGVAERPTGGADGDGVRCPRRLGGEAGREGAGAAGRRRALPVAEDLGALVLVQHVHAAEGEVGAVGDGVEDAGEAAHQAGRFGFAAEVGAVVDAQERPRPGTAAKVSG